MAGAALKHSHHLAARAAQACCPSQAVNPHGRRRSTAKCRFSKQPGQLGYEPFSVSQRCSDQGVQPAFHFVHPPNLAFQRTLTRCFASAMPYGRL